MNLQPVNKKKNQGYPTGSAYKEQMKALLAVAVAGLGTAAYADYQRDISLIYTQDVQFVEEVDVVDIVIPADITKKADSTKAKNEKEATKEQKAALEKIKKDVKAAAADLGADGFKKRRDATRKLIAVGGTTKQEPIPNQKGKTKTVMPYRTLVTEEMSALLQHPDPEVSQRAKDIIKAITPKPPPRRVPNVGGAVVW